MRRPGRSYGINVGEELDKAEHLLAGNRYRRALAHLEFAVEGLSDVCSKEDFARLEQLLSRVATGPWSPGVERALKLRDAARLNITRDEQSAMAQSRREKPLPPLLVFVVCLVVFVAGVTGASELTDHGHSGLSALVSIPTIMAGSCVLLLLIGGLVSAIRR